MSKLSVYVIAYNDEPNMRACLESVAWADELIVVDSYSTDGTEKISREFTDKVFQHEFHGFGRLGMKRWRMRAMNGCSASIRMSEPRRHSGTN